MKQILEYGIGTVYVAIFDGLDKPIIDTKYKKPLGMYVTSFEYTFDEEDSDSGELEIQIDNPDIVDNPSLKYMMPLKVQWGWLLPQNKKVVSPLKKVIVLKRRVSFTPNGVNLNIKFGCASNISKTESTNFSGINQDFEKFVTNLLQGKPSVQILDYEAVQEYETIIIEKLD